jgi:hypothetical protein
MLRSVDLACVFCLPGDASVVSSSASEWAIALFQLRPAPSNLASIEDSGERPCIIPRGPDCNVLPWLGRNQASPFFASSCAHEGMRRNDRSLWWNSPCD